jgi:hypothetical protein
MKNANGRDRQASVVHFAFLISSFLILHSFVIMAIGRLWVRAVAVRVPVPLTPALSRREREWFS